MTRSVEIPEAALAKATEAVKNRMLESGSFGDAAQEAIEAALPYLVPAGDENAYHYSTEEIAAKIADRVPHADMDGFTLSERLRIGKAVAPLFRELLPAAAPAGEGGYKTAGEELAALEAALPYLVPAGPAKCHRCGYELRPDDTYTRLDGTTYHLRSCPDRRPAPAGDGGLREALEKLIRRNNYPDGHVMTAALESLLAAHPAAPAPVVGVCEHPSDVFGPCTLLQGHELHGYLHQNTKGETWSNFGEPAHTAQPAAPAVLQPAHCTCDPGPEGQHRYWCAIREAEMRTLGVAPAAVPQPVDREALAKVLDKHHLRVGPSITCSCGRWTERPVGSILWEPDEFAQHQADAVLAVLAGEQEQVEP